MAINQEPDIHHLVLCANIFVKKGNRLLMMKRSPFKTYLPNYIQPIGGKVDLDEEPLQAAKRELREEAGILVANIRLEAVITEVMDGKSEKYPCNWLIFHFSGDFQGGDLLTTEEGELLWLTPEQIQKGKSMQSVKTIVEKLFDTNATLLFQKNVWKNEGKDLVSEFGELLTS